MADIELVKTPEGWLRPWSEEDAEKLSHWKIGAPLRATVRQPRNAAFHRKFFAMLNTAFEWQDEYDSKESFRWVVTIYAGFYDEVPSPKGGITFVPKSIAFHKMDEMEFAELYSKVVDVVLKYFVSDPLGQKAIVEFI